MPAVYSWRWTAIFALAVGLSTVTARSAVAQPADSVSAAVPAVCTEPTGATTTLHPGDIIHVKTLDEPALTRDYTVPEDGMVQFWRGGRYQVTAMTPACLQARLIQEYGRDLAHPNAIEVTVAYRIGVSGAVKTPGVYNADATMSVADVLALAGGVSSDGNAKQVRVLRANSRDPETVAASGAAMSTKIQSGDRIFVEQKSWVARNVAPTVTAASAVVYLLVSVLR